MSISELGIIFVVALVCSCCGFYKYVWFMSIGYGLAVAGIGVSLLFMFGKSLTIGTLLLCMVMIMYGTRLSSFLFVREMRNKAYQKVLAKVSKSDKKMPFLVKIILWFLLCGMYVLQTICVYSRFAHKVEDSMIVYISAFISLTGIVIESLADLEKSNQKKLRKDMVATKGLYKYVRCPNYNGEIIFWTGIFLSGIGAIHGYVEWTMAFIGYVLILYVMFDGAKRLEKRQKENYGELEEYWDYVDSTPILFPFVPIYHLSKTARR